MPNRVFPRITVSAITLPIAIALATASTSYADEDEQNPSPSSISENPTIGSSQASNTNWNGATVEIRELKRSENGYYTQLIWTLNNESSTPIGLGELQIRTYDYFGVTEGSGLVLIDETKGLRFHPYIDSDEDCVCAGADHAPNVFDLITEPGTQNTYWASYQLPPDVETVTVEIPGFLPVKDVPVS